VDSHLVQRVTWVSGTWISKVLSSFMKAKYTQSELNKSMGMTRIIRCVSCRVQPHQQVPLDLTGPILWKQSPSQYILSLSVSSGSCMSAALVQIGVYSFELASEQKSNVLDLTFFFLGGCQGRANSLGCYEQTLLQHSLHLGAVDSSWYYPPCLSRGRNEPDPIELHFVTESVC